MTCARYVNRIPTEIPRSFLLDGRLSLVLILCTFVLASTVSAQTNSWFNPSGGFWDDFRNWSLGARPTNAETVFITNAPSKTVTIDGYTSGTYPESLTISDLTVAADAGVTNTLVLSNAGATTPLHITDSLVVAGGAILLMTNSALQVDGIPSNLSCVDGIAVLAGTNQITGDLDAGFSTNALSQISLAGSQLVLSNGCEVFGFYGSSQVLLSNSTLLVIENDWVPSNSIGSPVFLGLESGSQGSLALNGGLLSAPSHIALGGEANSAGTISLNGGQLLATNGFLICVGGNGSGQMLVSNTSLSANCLVVASGQSSLGTLTIAGSTATFSGVLDVGGGWGATGTAAIASSQVTITNFPLIVGSYGWGQMTVTNSAMAAKSIVVGYGPGSQGFLNLTTSSVSVLSNMIVGFSSNASGVFQISDGSLAVTNQAGTAGLVLGCWGTGSLIQNGGSLVLNQLAMGSGNATSSVVCCYSTNVIGGVGVGQTTLTNGSLFAQTVVIGSGLGSQGTLMVSGGAAFISSNITVGISNATGVIQLTGGSLAITNQAGSAQLIIGQSGQGSLIQSGGVLTVDHWLATNSSGSVVTLNAGSFSATSGIVSNGSAFVVGDGVDAANYRLLGGIHSFVKGLRIRNSGTLSGCGTVTGTVTVDHGGLVQGDCGGLLTFTGIVTNNGLLRVINGGTLQSYGTLVNNGTIDAINGFTNFHSVFINNGTVLDAKSVVVSQVAPSGQDFVVWISSVMGHTYQLQYTASFTPATWASTGAPQSGTGGVLTFTDPGGTTNGVSRFYRIDVTAP